MVSQDGPLRGSASSATEKGIIAEARQVMSAPEMMQIRHAQALGKPVILKIGGRLIQYEPGFPFSGITNFEEKWVRFRPGGFSVRSGTLKDRSPRTVSVDDQRGSRHWRRTEQCGDQGSL